jgi:hypothetical protein
VKNNNIVFTNLRNFQYKIKNSNYTDFDYFKQYLEYLDYYRGYGNGISYSSKMLNVLHINRGISN